MKAKRKLVSVAKPKKVTVKFFVNKAVLPLVDGRTKRYPLYALITYDRKNTMMRCHYGQYYKDLNEIDKVHYPGLLAMEERIIRKIISYELGKKSVEFDLKGTHKKYDQCSIGIHELLESYLKNQLWSTVSRLEPFDYANALNFTDAKVEFITLHKIATKIYKDLASLQSQAITQEIEIFQTFMKIYQGSFFQYCFPVIIEWIDGSATNDYRNKLKKLYPNSPAVIKKSIDFIERIVYNYSGIAHS